MDNRITQYIIKNSKKRNNSLKYDFMPSLQEIIERPSHIGGKVIIITIALLFIMAITWASVSKIDAVVSGTGNIIPKDKIVELHPIVGGEIDLINVQVGDYVEEGELLFSIKNENTTIELEQINDNIQWYEIKKEIIQNILKSDEYEIDIDEYDSKFANGIKQLKLEIDIYNDQQKQEQKDLGKIKGELENATDNKEISELKEGVESYENSILLSEKTLKSQLYNELFGLERELNNYYAQVEKLNIENQKYEIRSPINGYINMLSVVSIGQTISLNNSLASIIPSDSEIQFECFIPDAERSQIQEGDEVVIKLSAYSYSDYGAITGKINYISPSTFNNEKYGNVYIVDVDIDEDKLNPNINLTSGLSGTAEIVVGKRTVLWYFLEPIMGGLQDSLKES